MTFCNDAAFIRWLSQSGDPGLLPWVAVILYLGASGCACLAATHGKGGSQRLFWMSIAVLSLTMALNKQLDLQTLILRCGRVFVQANGWDGRRRLVEQAFAGVMAGCSRFS